MKKILIFITVLFSQAAYSQQVEDWIYFKDSTIAKGLVLEIKEGIIKVETGEGIKEYRFYKIAEIVKHNPELMEEERFIQTKKGSIKIGGSFSYSYVNYETPNDYISNDVYYHETQNHSFTKFQLNPSIIYFIDDNFGAGILITIEGASSSGSDMEYNVGAGFSLQYYFASGYIRPFINMETQMININEKNAYQITGGAGLSLAMDKNIALQFMVQYGKTSFTDFQSQEIFLYTIGLAYFLF